MCAKQQAIGLVTGSGATGGGAFRPCTTGIATFIESHWGSVECESLENGIDYVGEFGGAGELDSAIGARSGCAGEGYGFEGAWFSERIGGHYLRRVEASDDAFVGQAEDVGDLFVAAGVHVCEGGSAIGGAI